MAAWSLRNDNIDYGGYSQTEIEDFTGRIPLLLDNCIESGELRLDAPEVTSIARQSTRFANAMKNTLSDREWAQ